MAEKPRSHGAGRGANSRSRRDQGQAQPIEADPASDGDGTDTVPGQLARDDRGNITWEWSDNPELQADDILGSNARLRALSPKNLSIEDEENHLAAVNRDPLPRKAPKSGYNPYNSGEPTKQTWKKKRDLRELDKWIALKKRMQAKPGED